MKHPHDRLVKQVFGVVEHARGLLLSILPEEVSSELDFDSLEPIPASFIGRRDQERLADLAFRLRAKAGKPVVVYVLFEHRSSASRWLVLDMLGCVVRPLESCRRRDSSIPVVLPVALVHDSRKRQVVTRLEGLVSAPDALPSVQHPLRFEILLHDLRALQLSQLLRPPMTDFGALTLVLLRFARSGELVEVLVSLSELVNRVLDGAQGGERVGLLMRYTLHVSPAIEPEILAATMATRIDPRVGDIVMSTAERLREEGRREGIEQGIEQGQRGMLRALIESRFGALENAEREQLESASPEELTRLAERVLTATSLRELFAR